MSWSFVAGFACGAVLFDVMWRALFYMWMRLYERQQEHMEWYRNQLFGDQDD